MHDVTTNMTAFQSQKINSLRDIPPSLLQKTFSPINNGRAESYEHPATGHFVNDDDDFSDHDSHYSEDLADDYPEELFNSTSVPNMTRQLLDFADFVNNDIKKFFGPKKGSEDSCDIYADKWKTIKSGRERYYRDLLRIAEGDSDISKTNRDDVVSESIQADQDNRHTFSGRFDKRLGLGPFKELFERGLKGFVSERKSRTKDGQKSIETVPMHERRFPESFWKPPENLTKKHQGSVSQTNISNSSPKPPDFSDLLETWTMFGEHQFHGDMAGDSTLALPGTVHQRRV